MDRWLKLLFLFVLCVCFAACSSTTPVTKATPPPSEQKITEEDLTDANQAHPGAGAQEQQPAFSGPPAPPVEETSPSVDTGPRPPRRIKWEDMGGRGKGWRDDDSGTEREP
jgi:hypothetical protein